MVRAGEVAGRKEGLYVPCCLDPAWHEKENSVPALGSVKNGDSGKAANRPLLDGSEAR